MNERKFQFYDEPFVKSYTYIPDDSCRNNIDEACAELLVNLNYLLVVVDADKKLLKLQQHCHELQQ